MIILHYGKNYNIIEVGQPYLRTLLLFQLFTKTGGTI